MTSHGWQTAQLPSVCLHQRQQRFQQSPVALPRLWCAPRSPYQSNVSIAVLPLRPGTTETVSLQDRAPRWAVGTVKIFSDDGGTELAAGPPGSFLIPIGVQTGAKVRPSLPTGLRSTLHTGYNQARGGLRRYAVEYGPVLLAAVGAVDEAVGAVVVSLPAGANPSDPGSWLRRGNGAEGGLVFRVVGSEAAGAPTSRHPMSLSTRYSMCMRQFADVWR